MLRAARRALGCVVAITSEALCYNAGDLLGGVRKVRGAKRGTVRGLSHLRKLRAALSCGVGL